MLIRLGRVVKACLRPVIVHLQENKAALKQKHTASALLGFRRCEISLQACINRKPPSRRAEATILKPAFQEDSWKYSQLKRDLHGPLYGSWVWWSTPQQITVSKPACDFLKFVGFNSMGWVTVNSNTGIHWVQRTWQATCSKFLVVTCEKLLGASKFSRVGSSKSVLTDLSLFSSWTLQEKAISRTQTQRMSFPSRIWWVSGLKRRVDMTACGDASTEVTLAPMCCSMAVHRPKPHVISSRFLSFVATCYRACSSVLFET